MPIQYLYPISDRLTNGYSSVDTPYYTNVNNGVSTANDADYCNINAYTNGGLAQDFYGNIVQATINFNLSFFIGDIDYIPSTVDIIHRTKNVGSSGYIMCDIRASGSQLTNTLGEFNGFNAPTGIFLSDYTNITNRLILSNSYSGNYQDLYIEFGFFNFSNSEPASFYLSELEVVISGDHFVNNDNLFTTLHIFNSETINSGIDLYTHGAYYQDSGLEFHTHGHSGLSDIKPLFIKGGTYEDSGLSLYEDGYDNQSSGLSLFTKGSIHLDNDITLYTSGSQQPYKAITLYTANIVEESSGVDLFTFGAYFQDSGLSLYLPICTKDYRFQPLYDMENFPDPIETGYPYPNPGSNYSSYNGIDSLQRWGFYNTSVLWTDKYHFNVDSDFSEDYYCTEYDSECIYNKPPTDLGGVFGGGKVYWYESYQYLRNQNETRSVVDFSSRPYDESSNPMSARLRMRVDSDTRFKLVSASISNSVADFILQSAMILDGFGVCAPYEIPLSIENNIGRWTGNNDYITRIEAMFTVDEETLSNSFHYPTGLVHYSQSGNNFRDLYRNVKVHKNHTGDSYVNGEGLYLGESITGYKSAVTVYTENWFGFEFDSIPDITTRKYIGFKITRCLDDNFDRLHVTATVYRNFNEILCQAFIFPYTATNLYGNGVFDNYLVNSGSMTYWYEIDQDLSAESGIQVGFKVDGSNFDIGATADVDIQNNLQGCFIYEDIAGNGWDELGKIKISQLDVVFELPCIPTGIDDNITLYTAGHLMTDSGTTLYISGGIHESIPLYTSGMYFSRSGLDMYIRGAAHGDMPLYIKGFGGTETKTSTLYIDAQDSGVDYGSISNTLTLFTKSILLPSGSGDGLNLYISGPESGIARDFGIEMFTEGYGGTSYAGVDLFSSARDSGVHYGYGANLADLYIQSVPNSSGDMTLYITAPESGFIRDFGIEMYTSGWGGTEYAGTDLFLNARDSGVQYGYGVNSLELYIHSIPNYSGDMTLYITAPESGFLSDSMSLTVNNTDEWVVKYSGFNMYLRALESNNSGVNMFIKTQEKYDYSGDLSLHIFGTGVLSSNSNSDLYVCGKTQPDGNINLFLAVATPDSGGTNLYIKGWGGTAIKEMTLYTEGYGGTVSGVTELFILGPNPDKMSGDMSFFIEGGGTDDRSQSIDLHTVGSTDGGYLNSVPMYTIGGFDIGEMPLYLENQQQYSSLAASTDLYVNGFDGTSIEGVFGSSASMYTFGSGSSNQVNLVIVNSGMSSLAQQMPITMVGRDIIYDSTTNGFELSIHNYFDLLTSGIELFMYSQQNYNSSGDMNLYMSRSVESAAMRAEMYVSGPLGENNAFNMYINGGTDSYDSVTLCLPSSVGFEMKKVNTYVHGY